VRSWVCVVGVVVWVELVGWICRSFVVDDVLVVMGLGFFCAVIVDLVRLLVFLMVILLRIG